MGSSSSSLRRSWEGESGTEETVGSVELAVRRLFETAVGRVRKSSELLMVVGRTTPSARLSLTVAVRCLD